MRCAATSVKSAWRKTTTVRIWTICCSRSTATSASRPWTGAIPQARLGQLQFIHILEACVERLPAQTGRVFLMREWLELETDEICKELGITPTNLWVILHRARLKLRECLQLSGFAPTAPR